MDQPQSAQAQPEFVEEPAIYYFTKTLSAGQHISNIAVNVDRDADFLWTGINGSSDDAYTLNVQLPSQRFISSAEMLNTDFVSPDPEQPTAIGPPPIYRAGSVGPSLALTNLLNGNNNVSLVFTGIRRIKTT